MCIIIMGMGGKPSQLLNIPLVQKDDITTIRCFSGGGTVVVDTSSLWICVHGKSCKWSVDYVFGNVFERCKLDAIQRKRRLLQQDYNGEKEGEKKEDMYPNFTLRENDYVLGQHKIGGNAQAITAQGWLHHTSFLWDYQQENMAYLSLPQKRPEYRGDRIHDDF
uniref:BPL/LPL catalytic domain-containing protein n=1 Tax=Ditylum brightwellii TaxID=49249 RepID=A0A7S4RBA9_9STRA